MSITKFKFNYKSPVRRGRMLNHPYTVLWFDTATGAIEAIAFTAWLEGIPAPLGKLANVGSVGAAMELKEAQEDNLNPLEVAEDCEDVEIVLSDAYGRKKVKLWLPGMKKGMDYTGIIGGAFNIRHYSGDAMTRIRSITPKPVKVKDILP